MSVGDKTVSDPSHQRGEVGRGATAPTVCPQSARPPGLPPSCLLPLGGEPRRWPRGGGVSSARTSLLFPIMSNDKEIQFCKAKLFCAHVRWAYALTAPHPPRDPPTGRCPAFSS